MLRSPEYLMNASKANVQTSTSVATRSIENAAELVRRQLMVAMTLAGERAKTLKSASSAAAVPVRSLLAERDERREIQLQNILDLSCQCLEVTAKAQTELVRLIQENFQNMNEAMRLRSNAPAGANGVAKTLRRV